MLLHLHARPSYRPCLVLPIRRRILAIADSAAQRMQSPPCVCYDQRTRSQERAACSVAAPPVELASPCGRHHTRSVIPIAGSPDSSLRRAAVGLTAAVTSSFRPVMQ
ncbi:hypothetical protein EVG20_g7343 [Dentipellis fragilis]|uniref:Uncharacterized protein n=1 Tax=Dentipellis fragilis TaxID=205917 RepID=A0A4Y9YDQ2_9AGAM|nr:hypothetical protein EVG20_g7343 [Dentipellis fragilis]